MAEPRPDIERQSAVRLSKVIAHALRHQPWLYELELDDEGWVSAETLLAALAHERAEWSDLRENDLARMIAAHAQAVRPFVH